MQSIKIITNIAIIIALYYVVYYIYVGILHPIPALGDSWDYHIPIAKTILDGSFLHPSSDWYVKWYYPGSSEIFLSLFMFLHIPLTLSNLFAIIILFFCCWKLALTFQVKSSYAILFALTFVTLNVIVRWMNAISIDVWVAIFFILTIILLENPKKNIRYFIKLGFVAGMIVGSKYTTWFYLILLAIFYGKKLLPTINLVRIIAFIIPFSIVGLFWYVRNYIFINNPFYPLPMLGFKGSSNSFDGQNVLHAIVTRPMDMFNAGFGEYKLWIFTILIALISLGYQFLIKKKFHLETHHKLFLLGLGCLLPFPTFPTSLEPWSMVSTFRYSFPAFILLILGTFILAQKYKKEELVGYVAIACMINVLSMAYYPKLLLVYLPLSLLIFYFTKTLIQVWRGLKGL